MAKRGPKGPSKWTEDKAMELAAELLEWLKYGSDNVFFEEFLVVDRGLYPQLISDLVKRYDKFAEAIKVARKMQEMKLANRLLSSRNPAGAIFALKNNQHHWSDKQEIKSDNVQRHYTGGSLRDKTEEELMGVAEEQYRS